MLRQVVQRVCGVFRQGTRGAPCQAANRSCRRVPTCARLWPCRTREQGSDKSSSRPAITLLSATVFSLASKFMGDKDEGLTPAEENIVYHLKKAKLNIMKGEMEEAEKILHKTLYLAQECKSIRAIIYTYDLAEQLFKATLTHMVNQGVKQDDNSFIEISLKLATIYATMNREDLAVAGFQSCIMTLGDKIEKEKDPPEETVEERRNTQILLGMCMESYARYLVAISQLMHAQILYEKALMICRDALGDLHPQTVTLLSDLATVLEAQNHFAEAFTYVKEAVDLAKQTDHPNQHIILGNMAMILLNKGNLVDAEQFLKEALTKAEEKKDQESMYYINLGFLELNRRKMMQKHKP